MTGSRSRLRNEPTEFHFLLTQHTACPYLVVRTFENLEFFSMKQLLRKIDASRSRYVLAFPHLSSNGTRKVRAVLISTSLRSKTVNQIMYKV